jgi:hypothetical protein
MGNDGFTATKLGDFFLAWGGIIQFQSVSGGIIALLRMSFAVHISFDASHALVQ